MEARTPRDVLDKLIQRAIVTRMIGYPHYRQVEDAILRGEELPEACKPGRLLDDILTDYERKVLKGLTSDMTVSERHWSK